MRRNIEDIIDQHKNDPGIDIHKLKPGTKIKVRTVYSLYEFEVTEKPGYLMTVGGKYIPSKTLCYFSGSTWGGSMLKIGWIGQEMNMEIWIACKRKLTTSMVRKAVIIGEGWEYTVWDLNSN